MSKFLLTPVLLFLFISGFRSFSRHYRPASPDIIPGKNRDVVKDKLMAETANADSNILFTKAEVAPSIESLVWTNHLQVHLASYIEKAAEQHIPGGRYTVYVHFIVERDGRISDIQALNDPGHGMKEMAIQIIKTSPQWNPATQNGHQVRCYCTQPISFVIGGG